MKKVCFLSWHFDSPQVFLDYLRKMTPGQSGKWKDIVAVTTPDEADFCIVMDGTNEKTPPERTIYFGEHPKIEEQGLSPAFRTFENKPCLARIRLDKHLNLGEWWLGYTYDELINLQPPQKPKSIACIMTYQEHNAMYAQRVKFMEFLVKSLGHKGIDLFGRPEQRFLSNITLQKVYKGPLGCNDPDGKAGQHTSGKEILKDYQYSLEFDVGPTKNYLSERFYDALLLWCIPFYFGSTNVQDFIPSAAFHQIDIYNLSKEQIERIKTMWDYDWLKGIQIDSSKGTAPSTILHSVEAARDLLLNKYQIWPAIHHVINNLDKYK